MDILNSMKEAGVERGLDENKERTLEVQKFKGASEIVLQSDQFIDELIDAVCSLKGTTIEGMAVLWDSYANETVVNAVLAAERQSKKLAFDHNDE